MQGKALLTELTNTFRKTQREWGDGMALQTRGSPRGGVIGNITSVRSLQKKRGSEEAQGGGNPVRRVCILNERRKEKAWEVASYYSMVVRRDHAKRLRTRGEEKRELPGGGAREGYEAGEAFELLNPH